MASDDDDDELQTCVCCWKETPWHLGTCGHVLCTQCAARWCAQQPTCPVCRRDVTGLHGWTPGRGQDVRIVSLAEGTHPGITIQSHTKGVRVLNVDPRDRCAAAGVRRGMILTDINGIPCRNADHVVRILQAIKRAKESAVLVLAEPPPAQKPRARWWWRRFRRARA